MACFGFNTRCPECVKPKQISNLVIVALLGFGMLHHDESSAGTQGSRENISKVRKESTDSQGTALNIEGVMHQVLLTEQHAQSLLDRAVAKIQSGQEEQAVTILGHLVQARGFSGALRSRITQLYQRYADTIEDADYLKRLQINGDYNASLEKSTDEPEEDSSYSTNAYQSFTLSASFELTDQIDLYGELEFDSWSTGSSIFDVSTDFDVGYGDLSATYNFDTPTASTSLTLGRQSLSDSRGWWWDTSVDSLQIHESGKRWAYNLGVSSDWLPVKVGGDSVRNENNSYNAFGHLSRNLSGNHFVDTFFLLQRENNSPLIEGQTTLNADHDDEVSNLNWFGLRLHGFVDAKVATSPLYYWFDLARVSGTVADIDVQYNEIDNNYTVNSLTQNKVLGWAMDLGFTMQSALPLKPRLGLSVARTSKDKMLRDENDNTYRQTGWETNVSQLAGYNDAANHPEWSIYGAALSPTLSNIHIVSARIGFPLKSTGKSTGKSAGFLQISYHRYHQVAVADFMSDTNFDLDPNGLSRNIGQGVDVSLPLASGSRWESNVAYSVFQAGDAFTDLKGDNYHLLEVDLEFSF